LPRPGEDVFERGGKLKRIKVERFRVQHSGLKNVKPSGVEGLRLFAPTAALHPMGEVEHLKFSAIINARVFRGRTR